MNHYYQLICKNGHRITDNYNPNNPHEEFCPNCGAQLIWKCSNCESPIIGQPIENFLPINSYIKKPNNCIKCGNPFPWNKDINKQSDHNYKKDSKFFIENIFSRFHIIVTQLQKRYNKREPMIISDEYDVQDLLHSLLKLYFDDVRPEEWTPSYAGACSRVDFLIKNENIVIEVKKTREQLKQKEIGEQLIIDIARYKNHPNCKFLFCFVYDPDRLISNPSCLENDLSSNDNLPVKVIITPKGL
jgi:hypothetical protein